MLVFIIVFLLLVGIDQGVKALILQYLVPVGESVLLIPKVLQLTYVENYGAAFGLLTNQKVLLLIITICLVVVGALFLWKNHKKTSPLINISVVLILSGGVGNIIDRMLHGFVVDYIDISPLFSYPVFNFADCCVVIGCILLVIGVIRQEYIVKHEKN